jgi:hypothetical protein
MLRRVEVGLAVPVDVDADLDLAHELHQVERRLAQAVAVADDDRRRCGVHTLGRVDRAVAVLVDPAPAGRYDHRRPARAQDADGAERARRRARRR